MTLLAFEDVHKRFPDGAREITVLDGASFALDADDFVGIWGTRRSGKSTILQLAAGLQAPDSGTIRLAGEDLARLSNDRRAWLWRERVALVEAAPLSHRCLAVEYVALALWSSDLLTAREVKAKARRVLERLGVSGCADVEVNTLAEDELFRVRLARALVRDPLLLLVDEPPVLRSPSESNALYGLLKSLGGEPGLAVVVASEDLELVAKAQRMMSIGGGKLRAMDRPGEIVQFSARGAAGHSRP